MIEERYFRKQIKLTDIDGKDWFGTVDDIVSELDSDSGETELLLAVGPGLVEFKESEIAGIEEQANPV